MGCLDWDVCSSINQSYEQSMCILTVVMPVRPSSIIIVMGMRPLKCLQGRFSQSSPPCALRGYASLRASAMPSRCPARSCTLPSSGNGVPCWYRWIARGLVPTGSASNIILSALLTPQSSRTAINVDASFALSSSDGEFMGESWPKLKILSMVFYYWLTVFSIVRSTG